jgi:membrane protease YdiL (CAAX protease family)
MTSIKPDELHVSAWFAGPNRKPTIILLLAPILLTTFKYFGTKAFFLSHLAERFAFAGNLERSAELYHFLSSFVLLGIIPVLVVRFVFREPLAGYGVQRGDVSFNLKILLVAVPLLVAITYPSSRRSEFVAEYPLDKTAGASATHFAIHAATYLLFYMGWEFFFRGFMQFGLSDRLGPTNAILVQTMASCLAHIGKPPGEIYGAIVSGVIWGWIVSRTRSLWGVLVMHWALGVALDFFICFVGKAG